MLLVVAFRLSENSSILEPQKHACVPGGQFVRLNMDRFDLEKLWRVANRLIYRTAYYDFCYRLCRLVATAKRHGG